MADLFKEIIPAILQTKKNVLDDPKDYKAFLINRMLSYHLDCVAYVNQMNMHSSLDSDMQFQFLLNTIRPMKRKFQSWQKAEVTKDIESVKAFFGYSDQKAKEALRILNEEQLAEIKAKTDPGGVKR